MKGKRSEGRQLARWFEIVLAFVGLLCTSPVLLVLALIVKLTSKGPVLFRARRVGKDGEVFTLLKFRSMTVGAHENGSGITAAGDRRITPVGRILRRWKLDELPQLWNVLVGEMSFVGPRPEDPRFVSHYPERLKPILRYRPGITSPASIAYRDESALLTSDNHEIEYIENILPNKLEMDLRYLEHARFWEHVGVVWRTVFERSER